MNDFICDHKHEMRMWKTGLMSNIGLRINTEFVLTENNNIYYQEHIWVKIKIRVCQILGY